MKRIKGSFLPLFLGFIFIMIGLLSVAGIGVKAFGYANRTIEWKDLKAGDLISENVTITCDDMLSIRFEADTHYKNNDICHSQSVLTTDSNRHSFSSDENGFFHGIYNDYVYSPTDDEGKKGDTWSVKSTACYDLAGNSKIYCIDLQGCIYPETPSDITYIFDGGTDDIEGEESSKLIDGNAYTKWYCGPSHKSIPAGENNSYYWIDFHTSSPIKVNQYTLTTGNDNSSNKGRNPKSWILKAKKDETDSWTVIDTVVNDSILKDEDYKPYTFDTNVTGTWQYFRLLIDESKGGANIGIQLSEMSLGYKELPAGEAYISFADSFVDLQYWDCPYTNKLTNSGDGKVTYSSSNPDCVSVDSQSGAINIINMPDYSVTITANVEDTNNYKYKQKTASYVIEVLKYSIFFDKTYLKKSFNDKPFINTLNNSGMASVTFKSKDEKVTKVEPYTGEVTILDVGGSYITATVSPEYQQFYETIEAGYSIYIDRGIPEYTIPTDLFGEEGQLLSEIELPEGWEWLNDATISPKIAKYPARFTPTDTRHYQTVDEELEITVIPVAKYHRVTFETNGGNEIPEVHVLDGNRLKKPEDPKKEGYTFAGWYTDFELKKAYDFNLQVSGPLTLYAKWEKIEVVIPTPDPSSGNGNNDKPNENPSPAPETPQNQPAVEPQAQVVAEVQQPKVEAETKTEKRDNKQKNSSISKLNAGKKSITVTWKKQAAKGIKGYEIQYSTNNKFTKDAKIKSINKVKTVSTKIKGLKSGKKYYVRIRTFKKVGGEKVYSKWSKSKNIKVK